MIIVGEIHILDSDTGDMIACVEKSEFGSMNLWDIEGDVDAWYPRIRATGDAFWRELSAWVADMLHKEENSFYITDKNESEILW